jgi:tetrahydromethanopterin S-methyltransferase subunit G
LATFEAFCALLPTLWRLELGKKKAAKKTTKKAKKKATSNKRVVPKKSSDIPATKRHLDDFRSELKSEIASLNLRISSLESKIDSKFEEVLAAIHKNSALVEAQEDRNKYVLDGYSQLYKRQEDLEEKVDREVSEIKRMIKEQ